MQLPSVFPLQSALCSPLRSYAKNKIRGRRGGERNKNGGKMGKRRCRNGSTEGQRIEKKKEAEQKENKYWKNLSGAGPACSRQKGHRCMSASCQFPSCEQLCRDKPSLTAITHTLSLPALRGCHFVPSPQMYFLASSDS